MQFYEKIIFLLNLTQSTNRMLAQELQVDPSLISRLKTGARGIPRNKDFIKKMSAFFAKRCTTDYQRETISAMLGIKQTLTMKKEQLTEVLYYWLHGESDEVGRFMRTFETLKLEDAESPPESYTYSLHTGNMLYYGNEGKRAASRTLYQQLLTVKKPDTVFVFSDESDEWITEDYEFSRSLSEWGLSLIHYGYHIAMIFPPQSLAVQAFDSLLRWLPIYMTGKVNAYYYPRLRDNVHRRTVVVVPGEIALSSNSVASQHTSNATVLTTDNKMIQTYSEQFQYYWSLCRPMLNIYTKSGKLTQCLTQFLSQKGGRVQKVLTLSADTAPPELIAYCTEKKAHENQEKLWAFFLQEMQLLEAASENSEFIDITYLASAAEVRRGRVPIIFSYGDTENQLYYTPTLYVLHLKNILSILEKNENYHFIPVNAQILKDGMLLVKNEQRALLMRTTDPFTALEISQPHIVQLCQEHLYRIAEYAGYSGVMREKTVLKLKELIKELE